MCVISLVQPSRLSAYCNLQKTNMCPGTQKNIQILGLSNHIHICYLLVRPHEYESLEFDIAHLFDESNQHDWRRTQGATSNSAFTIWGFLTILLTSLYLAVTMFVYWETARSLAPICRQFINCHNITETQKDVFIQRATITFWVTITCRATRYTC